MSGRFFVRICFFIFCGALGFSTPTQGFFNFKALSQHPQWRELLHLDSKGHSRVRGQDFFLSLQGMTSAEAELESTWKAFTEGPEPQKYQCLYRARREFLRRVIPEMEHYLRPCPESDAWIEQFNPQKLYLIYADKTLSNPASSFGHVFFRIETKHNEGVQPLRDYAVNFAARTKDIQGALYAWYGLLGYFPGTYGMAPYHHLIKEYTHLEGRDLWQFEMNFTKEEIRFLMFHLLELERGYFDYYFLDQNCAQLILEALQVMRPEPSASEGSLWVLPLDVVAFAEEKQMILSYRYTASLRTHFEKSYAQLSSHRRHQLAHFLSSSTTSEDLKSFSVPELEAVQDTVSLKRAQDFETYQKKAYFVDRLRASGPTQATEKTVFPSKSLEIPKNSSISLGFYQQQVQEMQNQKYFLLQGRLFGHDLLTPQRHSAAWSELELFKIRGLAATASRWQVQQLTVINIFSSQDIKWVERPLTWGFKFSYENSWKLLGQAGWSFDATPSIRFMQLLQLELGHKNSGARWISPGLESILGVAIGSNSRSLIRWQLLPQDRGWSGQLTAGLSWKNRSQYELRWWIGTEQSEVLINYSF